MRFSIYSMNYENSKCVSDARWSSTSTMLTDSHKAQVRIWGSSLREKKKKKGLLRVRTEYNLAAWNNKVSSYSMNTLDNKVTGYRLDIRPVVGEGSAICIHPLRTCKISKTNTPISPLKKCESLPQPRVASAEPSWLETRCFLECYRARDVVIVAFGILQRRFSRLCIHKITYRVYV